MNKLLTTKEVAEILGVIIRRVQAMTVQACPDCNEQSKTSCPRCRGTGSKLPYVPAGKSGTGTIKMIHRWALELPDIKDPQVGRPRKERND